MIVTGTLAKYRSAAAAGYDAEANTTADRATVPPLTPAWQGALDASIAQVEDLRAEAGAA